MHAFVVYTLMEVSEASPTNTSRQPETEVALQARTQPGKIRGHLQSPCLPAVVLRHALRIAEGLLDQRDGAMIVLLSHRHT